MRAVCLLVVAAFLLLASLPARATERGPTEDGLDVVVDAVHTRGDEAIAVDLDVVVTNRVDDQPAPNTVTRFFFDRVLLVVPAEAVDLSATGPAGSLETLAAPGPAPGALEITVFLGERLFSGESRRLSISFRLPGDPPRSGGAFLVNPAATSFFAWGYGDRGSVTVAMGPGWRVTQSGSAMTDEGDGDWVARVDQPSSWVALFRAVRDDRLSRSTETVAGRTLTLAWWPGDEEWREAMVAVVAEVAPELDRLAGARPDVLALTERMGSESIDPAEVVPTLAGAWVPRFEDRWIGVGMAEVVADRATGLGRWSATPTSAAAFPLTDWPERGEAGYGRDAAAIVIDEVADEIGVDRLRAVLDVVRQARPTYPGPDDPGAAATGSRRLLDLFEDVGGSARASELFGAWVFPAADLDRRAEVRARYRSLAGAWQLPPGLRAAMRAWEYEEADRRMDRLVPVLDARDALGAVTARLGVAPPSHQPAFEQGEDPAVVLDHLEADLSAGRTLERAGNRVAAPRTFTQRVGLIGSDPAEDLADGLAAFGRGDLAETTQAAGRVGSSIEASARLGAIRLGWAGGVVVVLGLLGVAVGRRSSARGRGSVYAWSDPPRGDDDATDIGRDRGFDVGVGGSARRRPGGGQDPPPPRNPRHRRRRRGRW